MNLNSPPASPSPFPIHDHQIYNGDIDHPFGGTNNLSSSPAAVSCHIFFDSAAQDHMRYYNQQDQIYKLPQHISDEYRNHGYEIKNKVNIADQSGQLKLTLWKKQADHDGSLYQDNHHPMKWMKSHPSRVTLKIRNKTTNNLSSNSSASYTDNNNNPIRVCSDCNTTKTPLWRSGPKGPKSLCNACGIRQRKARRAMAAAAAANGNKADNIQPSMKIKGKNGGALKKRFKTGINSEAAASSSNVLQQNKKIGFEDFLINLSNNLSFHRVFPEDEKDAAILLMALSSGLVHGDFQFHDFIIKRKLVCLSALGRESMS